MPYTCQCCFKTYTTKSWYDKHIIWCTDTPHNTKIVLEELDDVPPPLTMYKMILDLSMKVKNLENKCYQLEKNQKIEKKSIPPPVEYNQKPNILFKNWYENIEVSKDVLELILKTTVVEQFIELVKQNAKDSCNLDEKIMPIIIDIEHNSIYIYEFECDGWVKVKRESFGNMIENLINKTQNRFNQDYNNNICDPSTSEFDDYLRNVEKIMSINKNSTMNNVYKGLIGK
tara:strand:+ start:7886 stop:8572 length:687 start_codon:yes stop_codon:yes gene_type:complete